MNQNFLSFLPEEIGNFARLEILGLEQNQLTSLPPQIGYCFMIRVREILMHV